ncbi:uncharacterized protein PG998_010769 [Apiospora kogelbergensis]|uniref:uncharacterized protein n=1 Tax=Apiospora kogelbergensis TaxID=1337665 RepID=UPI00312D60F3
MGSIKAAALTALWAATGLNQQYLGCFTVTQEPFQFNPQNPIAQPAAGQPQVGDPSRSYIHWDQGDLVNITITPAYCTEVCRAHGFQYTAMYDEGCRCGSNLNRLTSTTPDGTEDACNTVPCKGDRRDYCGTRTGARIYRDPSYKQASTIADRVLNYGVMGCFYKPNLPSGAAEQTSTNVVSPALCLAFCGNGAYPLAYMARNGDGTIACNCGSDFGVESHEALDAQSGVCGKSCTTGANSGCLGQDCCGDAGAQVYPVYANPDFMGCNIPRIPGKATVTDRDHPTPAGNAYTCFPTPASILNRARYTATVANRPTIERRVSFVATATVDAVKYVNYGCYPNADEVTPLVGAATIMPAAIPTVNVDTCVAACKGQNKEWAGLKGSFSGGAAKCVCGSGIDNAKLGTIDSMQSCNSPCDGVDNTQNCGPERGILAYAVSVSATTGTWYNNWFTTYSFTSTYSCTDTAATAGATTSSSVPATTTSSTDPMNTGGTTGGTGGTTGGTGGTTGGSGPNTTGGSGPNTTGGSDPNTTGGSGPNTTGGSGPNTTGGSGPNTVSGSGPNTVSGSGPNTTGGSGPNTTGGNGPSGSMTGPSGSMPTGPSGSMTGPNGSMTGPSGSMSTGGSDSGNPTGGSMTGPGGSMSTGPSGSMTGPSGSMSTGGGNVVALEAHLPPTLLTCPVLPTSPLGSVILGVIPGFVNSTNQKRDLSELYRRQSLGGFVGGAGPINPASCSDATPFNLTQGRLTSGGQAVATDPGVPFMAIRVTPGGSISTTFTVVNGILAWYNPAFFGGQAGFCQVASGQVFATFGAPGTGPAGCGTVSVVVYRATQCQNGAIISATPTTLAGPTATGGGDGGSGSGSGSGSGAGGNGNGNGNGGSGPSGGVPSSSGIYRLNQSPTGAICVTTTLAFVPGAPTFVPLRA